MIVITTKIYCKHNRKIIGTRIPYLWANNVVIDENDSKCPLIEG